MRLDDFVVLGRTVPEESNKYGVRVCMAGVSSELPGLVRVYPTMLGDPLAARSRVRLELQRNPKDSRKESFRLNREHIEAIDVLDSRIGESELKSLLEPWIVQSIQDANARRLSLCVIEPIESLTVTTRVRDEIGNPEQLWLFDDYTDSTSGGIKTGNTYYRAPYLKFADSDGLHDLQLREWGVYEALRKTPAIAASELHDRLHLNSGRVLLLCGNLNSRRNVWIVIKTFTFKQDCNLSFNFTD